MFSLHARTLPKLAIIVGVSAAALPAGEAPQPNDAPTWQLAFKFTPEQVVHYEDRFHSTIRLQKANKTVRILNNRKSRKHYRVLSVDKKGQGLVETVIDHIKIRAQQGDEPAITIDSSDGPDSCPVNFRTLLATIGRPIARSRCDSSGKLLNVLSISKSWLKAHPGASNQSLAKSLQKQGFLVPLPEQPVPIGGTWEESHEATTSDRVGKQHRITLKKIYSLQKVEKDLATITWKTIRLTPITDPRLLAQLIQLVDTGKVVLDIDRGVLISKTSNIDRTLVGPFGADTLMIARTKHELLLSEGD
ncbi:MAG TPA: hypothetical protein DCE47_20315 [Planctomycetaceae bacterium]|nr:hypothetical protein [Planctomycetaceae bacterium]HCD02456.1 hypothetical protein [Planctomycetaceae bacterium]